MKKTLPLILSILGLSVTLSSCGPDEGMDCRVVCDSVNAAPQNLLDYFVFNKGSYWVYQLKGTDTLDTLRFSGYREEFFEQKAGCNYGIRPCEMRYRISYGHSNLDKFPLTGSGVSNERYYITYSKSRDQWDVEHVSGSGGSGSFNYFLAFPFEKNQYYEVDRYLKDTAEIVTVPAGEFKCVTSSRPTLSTKPYRIQYMSFSKNTGLIKYEIGLNQIWELINYHHN